MIIVRVVFPIPIRKWFQYFMPSSMSPIVGGRIIAPFHSKQKIGIVISFFEKSDVSELNLKFVVSCIDNKSLYTSIFLDFLIWISDHYYHPIGHLFFSTLPKTLRNDGALQIKQDSQWYITEKGKTIHSHSIKVTNKENRILSLLQKNRILNSELKKLNISKFILKKLQIKNLCQVKIINKVMINNNNNLNLKKIFLDRTIIHEIKKILMRSTFAPFLITNTKLYVKVKFYLGLIQSILKKNLQILIIVSSCFEMDRIITILTEYFNIDIATMHSKLTEKKYFQIWIQTKNGDNAIVVGTKKSIFLPFFKLGLIIVMQEHSLSYKSLNRYRYNFKDISILRAYKEKIPIILDSDTPSLKTLHNVFLKKIYLVKNSSCFDGSKLKSKIINLHQEKIKLGLSQTLIQHIHETIQKGYQALLIFNQFNVYYCVLKCNICNEIITCKNCNNYFEINEYKNILYCSDCLITLKKPLFCLYCKTLSLFKYKINIKNIKDKIKKIFPKISLYFLLPQNNYVKNSLKSKMIKISHSRAMIIFISESIVKHYYFPHVHLIGLMSIDHYLCSLKFQSIEYFSQFYINLKKNIKDSVYAPQIYIQTFFSENIYLQELCTNGYFSVSNKILMLRKKFFLPPWSYQRVFYSESISVEKNIIFLEFLRKIIKKQSKKYNFLIWCVGPHPCFLFKKSKKYFHQLLIQSQSRSCLNKITHLSIDIINCFLISKQVTWFIDTEPN